MTTREVILDGGSPWGFRMHGGADLQQRLRISRVNPGSKASFKGVREGDFITSIDGQSTKDISNSEAHALLKSAGDHLKLCLNEEYIESSKRRKFKTVIHETHSETIKTSCISSSTTYTSTNELMENNRSKPKAEENHSNGVISQRSTLSSSASIDSPNSSDIRGPIGIGNVLLMEGNLKKDNYEYRVDSPNIISTMIKSRSLDDEQPVITEINDSEDTSSESNNAIMVVNDADDIIWESTQELNNSLFTNHELANLTIISCEEKVDLRKFLESLDFSGIPTSLIQEFKPITNLDVISEEGSDISSEMDMIRPSFGEIKYETPIVINIDDICKIGVIKSERGSAVIERLSSSSEEDSKCGVVTDRLSRSSSEDSNYCDNKLLELTSEIISAVKNSSTEDQDNIAFRKEFNDLLREQSLIDHDNNKRQVSSESDESCYSSTTVVCSLQNEVIEEKTIVDEEENLIKFIEEAMCNSSKADSFNENNLNNSNKERAMDKTNNNNVAVDQINQEISRGELETFQIDSDKNVENKITNLGTLGTEEVCESNISGNELIEKQHNLDSKNCIQTYLNKINIDDSLVSLDWTSNNKPNTLRELCLNSLTSLPFGLEMLEELAQVAKHLEKFTTNVPNLNFPLTQNYKQNNSNFPSYLNIFKTHILDSKRNNLLFKDNNNNYNDDKFINNQRIIDQKNRRFSLPHEYLVKQMQYLIDCEKEIQEELEILENEKRRLQKQYLLSDERNEMNILSNPEEILRQEMFNEYMRKVIARKERQNKNVIKISLMEHSNNKTDHHNCNDLENEFIRKARYRLEKQGQIYENIETSQKLGVFKVLDENSESDEIKESESIPACSIQKVEGVWSPGQKRNFDREELHREISQDSSQDKTDDTIPPVWTPRSAGSSPTSERKEFRPVNFESPVLGRKERTKSDGSASNVNNQDTPWGRTESSEEKTLTSSYSAPGPGFLDFSRLPKAQNPTITLLQRAREGQIPKSSSCSETNLKANVVKRSADPGYNTRTESFSDSDGERSKKTVHIISPKKYDGIGPTNKDGMPLSLRSEIRDANMSQWYKNMYDTIHKQKPSRYDDEEYVTVRYKQRRVGKYPFSTGYLSEPEVATYDSDAALTDNKYSTLDRRRPLATKQINHASSTLPRTDTTIISYTPEPLRSSISYKSPPGRIEHYKPGQSSISDNESKKWWDEVMEIFDGHLEQQRRPPQTKGYLSQALKESGYESDSTLVFRRRDDTTQQLSPQEQREVYKIIQKGGEVPLHGLRKLAPERPKESPRKYVENEVTIHYKAPIRQEIKESLSEDELARRQADAMRKIYEEERRRKYLQELHDIKSRRHTDNFIPSQKSPIPLNRYDDILNEYGPRIVSRPKSPEPRLVARALYNFVGQTSRELTFKKGDMIYIRRQVDKNWYEGEINAMVGLFPANYVEIVPYDSTKSTPRKPNEGQARAKYNFIAQTHLELSLAKGELVVVTRRVDDNWFEGRIGGRKGIFPVSYVEVLIDPTDASPANNQTKPVASPAAHSLLLNGSAGGKESMGTHTYVPSFPSPDLGVSYRAKPIQITGNGTYGSLKKNPVDKALHIETQSEPIPYRALYKYRPQNEDELELFEGDTVYVLEKCDDGWYVGSSERTGSFGTFPGNYVERI